MTLEKIPFENKSPQEIPHVAPPLPETIQPHEIILEYMEQGNVEQKDIDNLEKAFLPEFKKIFDDASEQKKTEWALLHKLPENLLEKIIKFQKNGQKLSMLPGIHDINNNLQILIVCTNDPKYKKIDALLH